MKTFEKVMEKAFTAGERNAIRQKAKEKAAAIRLQQIREFRNITQEEIAHSMGVSQSALSRFERRSNISIATLQRYIEALGGRIEVRAVFKEGSQDIFC